MQGVIKSYDPGTKEGTLLRDLDRAEYNLAADALSGSVFRMLRQGQRVVFDLDADGRATRLRLGSEVDLGTRPFPGHDPTEIERTAQQRRRTRSWRDGSTRSPRSRRPTESSGAMGPPTNTTGSAGCSWTMARSPG